MGGWPGLVKEVENICDTIGIKNINTTVLNKKEIKEAIMNHHYKEIKKEMVMKKKLQKIKDEDFRDLPEYFDWKSLDDARMAFRIRSEMVNDVKANFKNKYKNYISCDKCNMKKNEDQAHTMTCRGWEIERKGLDLNIMMDAVIFFKSVVKEKTNKKEEGLPGRTDCTGYSW